MLRDPQLKSYFEYLTLGTEIALSLSLPILGGYWLDQRIDTMPLWTLIGVGLGIVLLIWSMLRLIKRFDKKESDDR